ncbi:hypothetical protein Tco_1557051 [Tanacetum coccineum]
MGLTTISSDIKVVSSDWSLVSAVLGQMTYPVASLTPESARSYVMQGAPFTQGTIPSLKGSAHAKLLQSPAGPVLDIWFQVATWLKTFEEFTQGWVRLGCVDVDTQMMWMQRDYDYSLIVTQPLRAYEGEAEVPDYHIQTQSQRAQNILPGTCLVSSCSRVTLLEGDVVDFSIIKVNKFIFARGKLLFERVKLDDQFFLDLRHKMKQQGDDVASWWPWNVFEVLVSCYGDVMEPTSVSVKWLPFTNRNSDEAQTSEHG